MVAYEVSEGQIEFVQISRNPDAPYGLLQLSADVTQHSTSPHVTSLLVPLLSLFPYSIPRLGRRPPPRAGPFPVGGSLDPDAHLPASPLGVSICSRYAVFGAAVEDGSSLSAVMTDFELMGVDRFSGDTFDDGQQFRRLVDGQCGALKVAGIARDNAARASALG